MRMEPPICVGSERGNWGAKSSRYITSVSVDVRTMPGKSFKAIDNSVCVSGYVLRGYMRVWAHFYFFATALPSSELFQFHHEFESQHFRFNSLRMNQMHSCGAHHVTTLLSPSHPDFLSQEHLAGVGPPREDRGLRSDAGAAHRPRALRHAGAPQGAFCLVRAVHIHYYTTHTIPHTHTYKRPEQLMELH